MKIKKYQSILKKSENLSRAALKTSGLFKGSDVFSLVTAYVTAPALYCYVRQVLKTAQEKKIKRIYFLARDGYIMKKIAEIICKKQKINIDCRYLYCSRYVLKNALYYLCDTAEDFEKAGIFGRCAGQSPLNTLCRAGLSQETRQAIYKDISFTGDENEVMDNGHFSLFCDSLRKSELLLTTLKNCGKEAYENITAYFEEQGLFEAIPFALCDTGWLGSIQSALTDICGDKVKNSISGFYFGLFRGLDGDSFIPYLFSGEDAHKTVPKFCNNLFECFCAAPHGMTIGYQNTENGYQPIMKKQSKAMRELAEKQAEIITAFAENADVPLTEDDKALKEITRKLLISLMYKPDKDEAEIIGAFPFCDDATELYVTPLAEKCDKKSLKRLLFPVRMLNKMKGRNIYPDKGVYWLYGTIALSDAGPKVFYRMSVRMWEKLRLLKEKRNICH